MADAPGHGDLELMTAMMRNGHDTVPITITLPDGKTREFKYRPLSWLEKSRAVSAATTYEPEVDAAGKPLVRVRFNLDKYMAEALRKMLVDPPFPITDTFIENMRDEIGTQFQAIIPEPIGVMGASGNMGKDSGTSRAARRGSRQATKA